MHEEGPKHDAAATSVVYPARVDVANRSHDTESPTWAVSHAVAALRVSAMPVGAEGRWPRFLLAMWPLLEAGALEVRWLGSRGSVTCTVLARATSDSDEVARQQVMARLEALQKLAVLHLPGWRFVQLEGELLGGAVQPFEVADGGDLLRREVTVELRDEAFADVPLLHGADSKQLQVVIEALAGAAVPTMLSLAAAPTEIDVAELEVLHAELTQLELAAVSVDMPGQSRIDQAEDTPPSRIRVAAELLRRRVIAPEQLGFLRISLASAAALEQHLIATVQEAASTSAVALCWTPAAEAEDRSTFASNLWTIGFEPWGVQAREQPGHETVNDCYLASLHEILGLLIIPPPSQYSPLRITTIDPLPRPVPVSVPTSGRRIGTAATNPDRVVALAETERLRHTYVVGQTGTGKSTLLMNLILQDLRAGQGCCVIDPHGDLVDAVLERYPTDRASDLIVIDPSEQDSFVGLNPLDASGSEEQDFLIQQLIGMLYRIYDPARTGIIGPRFEHWLRNAALTVMADPEGGTLLDITRVFTDDKFMAEKLAHVTDPAVRSFWLDEMMQTSDYHKSEVLGWFVSKFSAFSANAAMRGMVGQRRSTIDVRRIMDEGKVLLVKLPRGVLGEINAKWLGMILVSKVQMAALGRAAMPISERRLFNLYVDEFQNFAYAEFESLIAEARKYALALTLAHQHVAQLTSETRSAVFGNIASWVVFRTGIHDAELLATDIHGYSAHDLTRLENRRCVVRTAIDGRPIPPFDITTLPPETQLTHAGTITGIVQQSRWSFSRSAASIQEEYLSSWGVVPQPHEDVPDETPLPPPSAEDLHLLWLQWDTAQLGGPARAVAAAKDLAYALGRIGDEKGAAGVLDLAMRHVGPSIEHAELRRGLVKWIARLGEHVGAKRSALQLARLVFSEGFGADEWHFVFEVAKEMSRDREFVGAFSHITELYESGEQPSWEDLEADPVFSSSGNP